MKCLQDPFCSGMNVQDEKKIGDINCQLTYKRPEHNENCKDKTWKFYKILNPQRKVLNFKGIRIWNFPCNLISLIFKFWKYFIWIHMKFDICDGIKLQYTHNIKVQLMVLDFSWIPSKLHHAYLVNVSFDEIFFVKQILLI